MSTWTYILFILACCGFGCRNTAGQKTPISKSIDDKKVIQVGASQLEHYYPLIKDKTIACVVNQTSVIGEVHLVDLLLNKGAHIEKIFAPEHGFRGTADAGATIEDGKDLSTGLPIISLYGKNKKPSADQLKGIDVVLFDIQDVGARFYTYLSTLHLVMEACAENEVQLIVLDRPNPNGHIIGGPVLDSSYRSFVGMHKIPILHGMTLGELAMMINGEGWLKGGLHCNLKVVSCVNYSHNDHYDLPIAPSPNLPNQKAVLLYPHLCLFEGTTVSIGRGTPTPFQVIGHPDLAPNYTHSFIPVKSFGAQYPKHQDKVCYGMALDTLSLNEIKSWNTLNLSFLFQLYKDLNTEEFFLENYFFDKLAGSDKLRLQMTEGLLEPEIRTLWQKDIDKFKTIREKYLLYPD